ncbi:MAG TPA: ATP-grasp domain-containing protein [Patescibacteria group bacterium]|nr:ATP-grasp domain-containing protein [Patescibacteria group bacterium]
MKILVLGGGNSPEKEVSLRSANNVQTALIKVGFEVIFYDPESGADELLNLARSCDLVFPILHGVGGEDGTLQKIFEEKDIKFLGSKSEVCENTLDKSKFYEICRENNIKIPKTEVVDKSSFINSHISKESFVLKPINGGSAIDTFIQRTLLPDFSIFNKLFEKYGNMILQELIAGIEVTDGILGDKVLPIVEIIPPLGEEFDFENRYNGKSKEFCPPKNIDGRVQNKIQTIALKVHKALGARHLSRVDMVVGSDGIYVLELNSIPGLTKMSLFPKEAEATGLSMEDLVKEFVRLTQNG